MKISSGIALSGCALLVALGTGCASKPAVRPVEAPVAQTTSGAVTGATKYTGNSVSVSGEIMAACKISFDNIAEAPKFGFDESALPSQDREVLARVAKCLTTGPLKGHAVKLVGRADPRGEAEYNMALGEHRAGSVETYLEQLGVDKGRLVDTSRGKLDATGSDEAGWQRDRRVDLALQ